MQVQAKAVIKQRLQVHSGKQSATISDEWWTCAGFEQFNIKVNAVARYRNRHYIKLSDTQYNTKYHTA